MVRRRFEIALFALALGCSRATAAPAPTAEVSSAATPLSGTVELAAAARADAGEDASAKHGAPALAALSGKKVLHVGDSMVGGKWGLTRALEGKLQAAGATLVRHTKVSESMTSFDRGPTLRDLIRTHDPDIVLITLGANDALVPHPEAFAKNVQNIVRRVGARECWWLGPPTPNQTGIVEVIRDNAGTCRFFDASKLTLDRASDGVHPSDRGAARWADAFWAAFTEDRAPE